MWVRLRRPLQPLRLPILLPSSSSQSLPAPPRNLPYPSRHPPRSHQKRTSKPLQSERETERIVLISLHFFLLLSSLCCSALFGLNISGSMVSHDFSNDPRVRSAEDLETAMITMVQSDRPQTRGKTVAASALHIAYATKGTLFNLYTSILN